MNFLRVRCLTGNKPFHFGADPDHDLLIRIPIWITIRITEFLTEFFTTAG